MNEEYLDNIQVDGLDETYAGNMDVEDVEASSVMLVDFIIDRSGSMDPYESIMQDCLKHYKQAICNSKQADEMLVSKTLFDNVIETGGYVAPEDFNTDYYARCYYREAAAAAGLHGTAQEQWHQRTCLHGHLDRWRRLWLDVSGKRRQTGSQGFDFQGNHRCFHCVWSGCFWGGRFYRNQASERKRGQQR